jgi:hypothetical protein
MKISLNIVFIFFVVNLSLAAKLSLEGTYQGKNIFVQNPSDVGGFGFCISKIYVNGDIVPVNFNATTISVDLKSMKISIGEPIFLVIHHGDDCTPVILNPEVLLPKSTFELQSISASPSGDLVWTSTGESGKLNFIVEQYKWDKWVTVGEVMGEGKSGTNNYIFKLFPHSGKNEVRVSQIDNTLKKRSSKSYSFISTTSKVFKSPTKVNDYVTFKSNGKEVETYYEIFDAYGNILKSGKSTKVDCRNLLNGLYFINFDNSTEKFIKN